MKQHEISIKTLNVYVKATKMPSTLQLVAKQNSFQNIAGAHYKFYKPT